MECTKQFRASAESSRSATPTKPLPSSSAEPAADMKRKVVEPSTTVAAKKPRLDVSGPSPSAGASSSARYPTHFFIV